ncbi:hypothetical protein V6N13_040839 [Hibiscus sabdariffa]|uniref:Uncharacterized protein n=1 Tax=Hibiscus sabdariffa TaxID=183260 RepID=A0ABR2R9M9_9ROSI
MRRKTRNNKRNHFCVRGRDGLLEVLPYRSWIPRPYIEVESTPNPSRWETVLDVEWRTLNLKTRQSSETLSTMPPGARGDGTAVACGSRIYVLGGRCSGDARCPDKMFNDSHFHNCVFYFDSVWSEGPPMLARRRSPSAFATGRKIYVFGSSYEGPFAEVFNIDLNRWDELPPPPAASDLDPHSVSQPVLFDSSRSRILVHFGSNRSLHAFRLDDGSWECLDPNMGDWSDISVIVDDVAYFLYGLGCGYFAERKKCLRAYHLVKKRWFPVTWSSEPPLAFAVSLLELFHLGNGLLCFVFIGDCFYFEKFRMEFKYGVYHAKAEPESIFTIPFEGNQVRISVL